MTHWLGLFICLTWFFLPGLAACWNPKDEALDEAKQEELAKQEKLSERYLAHMMNTDPNRQLDDTLREQRELRPLPSGVPQFTVVLDNPPWRVVRFPEFSTAKSMASNAYGIMNTDKHQAVLVDAPALSVPAIETWLYNEDLTLTAILLTHGHFDHASGLDALKAEHPKAKSYLGKEDVPLLAELPKQAYEFGLVSEAAAGVDDAIDGEPTLDLGYLELKTIAVPGHTPGQRVFYWSAANLLFSGDTVFTTSIGRTDFPHSGTTMDFIAAIVRMVDQLPENTVLLAGHGNPIMLAEVRRLNRYLRGRLRETAGETKKAEVENAAP